MTTACQPLTLICMRLANMHRVHKRMTTDTCDKCHETVGVYPSGQTVIAEAKRPNVQLICEICHLGEPADIMILAPGAIRERNESIPIHNDTKE